MKNASLLRISQLQAAMKKENLDAFWIQSPVNLFYFTGMELSAGNLWVLKNDAFLVVDGRYFDLCKKKSPVRVLQKEKGLKGAFKTKPKRIGFKKKMCTIESLEKIREEMPKGTLFDARDDLIEGLRGVKDEKELTALRKSAKLLWKSYGFILSRLRLGVSEKEIASDFQIYALKNGAEAFSFSPIIAFGAASANPHYRAGANKLKKGDTVLIDIGVIKDRYCSDMTRTFFFGKGSARMQKVKEIVLQAQRAAIAKCRPGVRLKEIDRAARAVIEEAGYGPRFIHGLGHGVGLDVHEYPFFSQNKDDTLKEGMVITIEPGVYLPGEGGVRIEDTIEITAKGARSFFPNLHDGKKV